MSAEQMQVFHPIAVQVPPGAAWAAQAVVWLARGLRTLGQTAWRGLEAQGQRRASRGLHAAAQRWQGQDPVLARKLRLAGHYLDPRNAGPLNTPHDQGMK
jgi:hypothetical protein